MHHLSRLRRLQAQLAGHRVDPLGIAQGCIFEMKLTIHLDHAVALNLQRFDLVAVLDRLEMLPGVSHDQQEQAGQRNAELAHLAAAARIFDLHQARIVDDLIEVDLRRADPEGRALAGCRRVKCAVAVAI